MLFETKELFQRQAAEKGLTLDLDIPHALPSTIRTDPLKVQQLLHNLVSNAIKFTSTGSVYLGAAMGKADGGRCLEIRVVDSGMGIPQDQIERIFTPFFQLPPVAGRWSSGTGLGLAISRHLADQLGGTLEVQSAVGTGTVFTLRLNCEGQSDSSLTYQQFLERRQVESRRPVRSETNRLSGWQVMIVDDDAAHRRLFQLYLEQRGATTLQAEHGREALQLFEEHRVDLVLVDMQMPVMDGIETMVQLRRQGFRKPVVGISAQADVSPGCEDRELGFSGWLQKPVDSRSLDRLLARLLRDEAIREPFSAGTSPPKRSLPKRADSVAPGTEMRRPLNGQPTPTVQVPAVGCPVAGHRWLAHSAHPVKNGHAARDGSVLPSAEAGNQPAQTAHSSWPVGRKRFAEIRPLFLATLRNKLDDIKECPLGRRGPLLRQFAHWLKGTAPTCGFPHFSRCVDDLERALEKHGDPSCISQLEEIEAIAESFGEAPGEALGRPVTRSFSFQNT